MLYYTHTHENRSNYYYNIISKYYICFICNFLLSLCLIFFPITQSGIAIYIILTRSRGCKIDPMIRPIQLQLDLNAEVNQWLNVLRILMIIRSNNYFSLDWFNSFHKIFPVFSVWRDCSTMWNSQTSPCSWLIEERMSELVCVEREGWVVGLLLVGPSPYLGLCKLVCKTHRLKCEQRWPKKKCEQRLDQKK